MPKRRRLGDLYVTGKEVKIDDGFGPVDVWLQKLNPVENEDALRHAAAVRSRHLTASVDRDSDEWQSAYSDVRDFSSREALVNLAIRDDLHQRRLSIEAEQAAQEEWSENDYLQGLVEAWEGSNEPRSTENGELVGHAKLTQSLKDRYDEDPEDPEAKRVHDEIQRFETQVENLVAAERERLIADWAETPLEELRIKGTEEILAHRASRAFLYEHETYQLFWSTREPSNHSELYFKNVDEVLVLSEKVRDLLLQHYRTLIVDVSEGKDSEGTPDSSPSSEPSAQEETGVSSGLEVAGV